MKPEDIIVGKRYVNAYYMGRVWLGIGMRRLFTDDEYVEKHLVLIEGPQNKYIGQMAQEGDNAAEGFWDGFQEESDSTIYIING